MDNLLEFSRLGRESVSLSIVDVEKLAREVFEELKQTFSDRAIQLKIGSLPPVSANPPMLRQVFVNLISNAVKFTRPVETAVIEIGSKAEGGKNIYYVRDNGVGFDPQYMGKLFGVFQRLHGAQEFEGTGVGLAIAQRIIQKHGGRIWAESTPGGGATFYFSL